MSRGKSLTLPRLAAILRDKAGYRS